jgi:hypothetical protein
MSFELQIKEWIHLDNELKNMNEKVKQIREKKTSLNNNIMEYVSKNNLFHSNINISDGKVKFTQSNICNPLTFKYLEKCLGEIIRNEKQVSQIMDYIKTKREIKSIYEIKRFYNN